MKNSKINELRAKIDNIDEKILNYLEERLKLSLLIAKEKLNNNLIVYNEKRENEIINNLKNKKHILISDEFIEKIYREILNNSVSEMNKYITKEKGDLKMDVYEKSLKKHYELNGKLEIKSRIQIDSLNNLSLAYTPGVASACKQIEKDSNSAYTLTRKGNMVAVITDGTAVLGLGDIGPSAAMPVMEGKCILFKELAGVDAFPICINSKDVDEIVNTIYLISKSFGGINLEDISAPRCFEIENKLKSLCDIPVFHDDQHGTAIVTAAALKNALKIVKKNKKDVKTVISGAGAAGSAIARLLIKIGFGDIILVDRFGIISKDSNYLDNKNKAELAKITNKQNISGSLGDALNGADIFIGVSAPNIVSEEMIKSMNKDSIVLAMANPTPEIMPDIAKKAGARIVGTGRSDFPNQINNVLAFPGLFKGVLASRQKTITDEIITATINAISDMVAENDLSEDNILPNPLDKKVAEKISDAIVNLFK